MATITEKSIGDRTRDGQSSIVRKIAIFALCDKPRLSLGSKWDYRRRNGMVGEKWMKIIKITFEKEDGTKFELSGKKAYNFTSAVIKLWDHHKEQEVKANAAFENLLMVMRK